MVLERQHDPEKSIADRKGLDVSQDQECRYWSGRFGISEDELKQAVMIAGPMPEDLARYLGKSPGPLEQTQRAPDFFKAKVQDARRIAERSTDEVMKFIGARPVASLLIGAAAGYLLGWVATGAVRARLRGRRTARAVRSAPLEHERLVQLREWPRARNLRRSV